MSQRNEEESRYELQELIDADRFEMALTKEVLTNPAEIAVMMLTRYPAWQKGQIPGYDQLVKEQDAAGDKDEKDPVRDSVRGNLSFHTIQSAKAFGYSVIVGNSADSHEEYQKRLNDLDIIILQREKSDRTFSILQMVDCIKNREDFPVGFLTEPEKVGLMPYLPLVVGPILRGEADIVVPMRNVSLFQKTYPDYMQESELKANVALNYLFRTYGYIPPGTFIDFFFGPVAWKNSPEVNDIIWKTWRTGLSKQIPEVRNSKEMYLPEVGLWKHVRKDEVLLPIPKALLAGLRVLSVEVPFRYPDAQHSHEKSVQARKREFDKKRKVQTGLVPERYLFFAEEMLRRRHHDSV